MDFSRGVLNYQEEHRKFHDGSKWAPIREGIDAQEVRGGSIRMPTCCMIPVATR